jgi:hypothetical protein
VTTANALSKILVTPCDQQEADVEFIANVGIFIPPSSSSTALVGSSSTAYNTQSAAPSTGLTPTPAVGQQTKPTTTMTTWPQYFSYVEAAFPGNTCISPEVNCFVRLIAWL